MNEVIVSIVTTGIIQKEVVVTVKCGCVTDYYYGPGGFISRMEDLGIDKATTLRTLMKVRKRENEFLFKGVSFFSYQNNKLKRGIYFK